MRTIRYIIQKEFIQVFRNKRMVPIIFVLPLIQLLILVNAATFEMKNIRMAVVDLDMSGSSRGIISKFEGSPFFRITHTGFSVTDAQEFIQQGKTDMVLVIPAQFEKRLVKENAGKVQFIINAINGVTAGLTNAYSTYILRSYNQSILSEWLAPSQMAGLRVIQADNQYWYNPKLNYTTFMVPGILALLVTLIGFILSGMNIVREKEIGTIEQINVTPIRKSQFIAGKLVPFWIIALFELAFGLVLGRLIYHIPIIGSLWLIFLSGGIYLFVILGFGLLVSTMTNTQQQAMFVSFFFMMIFILMGGLFTAIESMPRWAQIITWFNPVAYFLRIMRMVMLKGSSLADISGYLAALVVYGAVIISLAVRRYRKVA